MTENLDSRRLDLVHAAQQWIAALTESITAGFDVGTVPFPSAPERHRPGSRQRLNGTVPVPVSA